MTLSWHSSATRMILSWRPSAACWERVLDYYYHGSHLEPSQFGLDEWLRQEWNVQHRGHQNELWFQDDRDLTWFRLRWE